MTGGVDEAYGTDEFGLRITAWTNWFDCKVFWGFTFRAFVYGHVSVAEFNCDAPFEFFAVS